MYPGFLAFACLSFSFVSGWFSVSGTECRHVAGQSIKLHRDCRYIVCHVRQAT